MSEGRCGANGLCCGVSGVTAAAALSCIGQDKDGREAINIARRVQASYQRVIFGKKNLATIYVPPAPMFDGHRLSTKNNPLVQCMREREGVNQDPSRNNTHKSFKFFDLHVFIPCIICMILYHPQNWLIFQPPPLSADVIYGRFKVWKRSVHKHN